MKKLELEKLDNFISAYPKAQLCSYYLRGVCWNIAGKCQFAHGINELNYEYLKRFSEDNKKALVKDSEVAFNIQKYAFLIDKNYFHLHDFIINNKAQIPALKEFNYTLEEINLSSKIRTEIRKFMHYKIFCDLCDFFFTKKLEKDHTCHSNTGSCEKPDNKKKAYANVDEFDQFIKDIGLKYNYKIQAKNKILIKSFLEKKTKKKRTIIMLVPNLSEMFESFMTIILSYLTNLTTKELHKCFPLNYKFINEIVIKNTNIEDPFIYHYMQLKNISYSEFMEEIKSNTYFTKKLKEIIKANNNKVMLISAESHTLVENPDLIQDDKINKNNINTNNTKESNAKTTTHLIDENNIFYEENLLEKMNEFRSFFWEKYFNKLEQDNYTNKYGILPFEYIKESFFYSSKNKSSIQINENVLTNLIRKILLFDKNLFFINNNFKNYVINFNHFQGLKLADYFSEEKFDRRCKIKSEKIQKLVQDYFEFSQSEKLAEDEPEIRSESACIFTIIEKNIFEYFYFNKFNKAENQAEQQVENYKANNNIINKNIFSSGQQITNIFDLDKNSIDNDENNLTYKIFESQEIIVVDSIISFLYFLKKSKKFSYIAVDLEGKLAIQNARLNLIQIYDNESNQIFIIDVYKICYLPPHEDKDILFESLQILLTYLFENENITKVFHDGRRDVAALHCVFQACPTNYIDTSCIFSFLKQFILQKEFYDTFYMEKMQFILNQSEKNAKINFFNLFFNNSANAYGNNKPNKNKQNQTSSTSSSDNTGITVTDEIDPNDATSSSPNSKNPSDDKDNKSQAVSTNSLITSVNYTSHHEIPDYEIANLHSLINNYSNPGLNKVLENYEPKGNVNYLKDKMHEIMGDSSSKSTLFSERPINKDFLIYSAMDVKYLISSLEAMKTELKDVIKLFYPDLKKIDIELFLRIISNDHLKSFCNYE